jgi:FG-GAP-like repeat
MRILAYGHFLLPRPACQQKDSLQQTMELNSTTLTTVLPQPSAAAAGLTTDPITAAATAPTLAISTGGNTYATIAPKAVAPALTITAAGNDPITSINGATATIGKGFNASQDVLGIAGQTGDRGTITGTSINWSYSSTTGVLTLSGAASLATYQAALRQVTYVNTSQNPSAEDRQIDFALGSNPVNTANNHFYEFVAANGITWTAALAGAAGRSYFGLQGYLATITSQTEQDFINSKVQGNGWIGASNANTPADPGSSLADQWRWVTGPENGVAFWNGLAGGSAVAGQYANWNIDEPNNFNGAERYAHIIGDDRIPGPNGGSAVGRWNDLPNVNPTTYGPEFTPRGYIVEYGGLSTDPVIQISGSVIVYVPPLNNIRQLDFTGDGNADLFWRDQTGGDNYIWGMNGFTRISQAQLAGAAGNVPINWRVEAIADFDGNTRGDVLWRDYNTGTVAVWQMNNLAIANQATFAGVPLSWKIVGTADFNGDGRDDILWRDYASGQNAVWLMNGVQRTSQYALTTVPVDWRVSTVGDFNGNGRADILWLNDTTGASAIWLLNGTSAIVEQRLVTTSGLQDWFTPGVGFFDSGNNRSDLLWRNVSGGQGITFDWLMNGTAIASQAQLGGNVPSTWRVVGLGDFNRDGRTELVWRNYSGGGENAIWNINGTTVASQALIPALPLFNWEIV